MTETRIAAKAKAVSHNIPGAWTFIPVGDFSINDSDCDANIGELYYENGAYEIGPTVRVRDWVFCLERMTLAGRAAYPQNIIDPEIWVLSAFHGMDHYSFDKVHVGNPESLRPVFLTIIVHEFVPILCEDLFDGKAGIPSEVILTWPFKIEPWLPDSESVRKQVEALKTGNIMRGGGYVPPVTSASVPRDIKGPVSHHFLFDDDQ